MANHENDRLFDQALWAEKRGEWAEAISIYEQLQAELTEQDADYVRNCAIRIRDIQEMSRAASPLDPWAETHHAGTETINDDPAVPGSALTSSARGSLVGALRPIRWSIAIATALLLVDAAMFGQIGASFLVCPMWFVLSGVKNSIQRTGWRLTLVRIAIPPVTLSLVLINYRIQFQIGAARAQRIITACEEFRAANGEFPINLDELVPEYLTSVPRARYSMYYGQFVYDYLEGRPLLVWHVLPPFGRYIFSFEHRNWRYID